MRKLGLSCMRMIRGFLLLLISSLLVACAAKRDAYDVPKVRLPEKFVQAPVVLDETVSSAASSVEVSSVAPTVDLGKTAPSPEPNASASQLGPAASTKPAKQAHDAALPASPLSAALPEWWRMLGSEELNHLMNRALANNHDLRIATLRVVQLKARMEIAGADKLPTITLPVQSETYYPEWGIGNPNNSNRSRSTHQISLRADWRPDLWGETASLYESAQFQLMRATFQRDDMQRIIAARIAADYLEYLSLNDRLRTTRQTEITLKEMFESVKARVEIGDATITELEQQRAAGYAVRATIPVLEQQRVVVQNRIASFLGTVPEELNLSGQGMDTVTFPEVLPGVPSTLLLRRPDIRAVEARLLAADADIDVARARLLPPLDLTAQAGYGSLYLSSLFSSPTLLWNTVANLSVTLFDSGKRDKEVAFAKAIHEEMVETYIRVIYDAVREVDDSLSAIRYLGKQQKEQSVAVQSSFLAWSYSQEAYHAGAVDYLVVLDTERTYHRHLDDLYRYRMERYRGLIDLFSALGGGTHMGDKLPGQGHRPMPMPDEVDYGVVLDAVIAGLPPVVPPHEFSELIVREGNDPSGRDSSELTIAPYAESNGESGHLFSKKLAVTLTEAMPSIGQVDGIDWDGESLRTSNESWLVEIFGTFDRSAIFPAWRDLRARFPLLVESRKLLPRQQDSVQVNEMERQSQYRLFISVFPDRQTAEETCATLRAATLHCGVVSSSSLAYVDSYNTKRTLIDTRVVTTPVAESGLQTPDEKIDLVTSTEIKLAASGDSATRQEATVAPAAATRKDDLALPVAAEKIGKEEMPDQTEPEFWLVELPPVHDQRAIAAAWRNLYDHFPGQMKIRTLLTRQQPGESGGKTQYQLFIARFPTRSMATEFCGMLHSAMQTCNVLSSRSFAQRNTFDASWATNRSFAEQHEKVEQ
ncbi:MAG: TolC family protein [Gallionella sp.]|nr:TolC family protein [Gallionella sp.]